MSALRAKDTAQLARLSRIQGQLRGVRAMMMNGRYCLDIAGQIDAVVGALRRVRSEVVNDLIRSRANEARRKGDPAVLLRCLTQVMAPPATPERQPDMEDGGAHPVCGFCETTGGEVAPTESGVARTKERGQ